MKIAIDLSVISKEMLENTIATLEHYKKLKYPARSDVDSFFWAEGEAPEIEMPLEYKKYAAIHQSIPIVPEELIESSEGEEKIAPRDIHGDTWDPVIHSSRHSKTKEGAWRRKKGAPPRVNPEVSEAQETRECISAKELVELITHCVTKGIFTTEHIREILTSYGLTTVLDIYGNCTGDQRDSLYATIKTYIENTFDE